MLISPSTKGATFRHHPTQIAALNPSMSTPPPPAATDAVPGLSVSVTGEIIMVAVVLFFFLFVFFLILYLRVNRFIGASPAFGSFPAGDSGSAAVPSRRSLDPSVLKLLPVAVFSSADFKDGMECSICLSELAEGEATRLLPRCRHGFHLECIDMWFSSNNTCPICRSSVEPLCPPAPAAKNVILAAKNRAFPPEMNLSEDFSGEGSSSSAISDPMKPDGITAIDIPRIALESSAFALQSSPTPEAEEIKAPNLGSLRSIRRMLGSACSQRGYDIEHGPTEAAAVAGGGSGEEGSSSNKNSQRD